MNTFISLIFIAVKVAWIVLFWPAVFLIGLSLLYMIPALLFKGLVMGLRFLSVKLNDYLTPKKEQKTTSSSHQNHTTDDKSSHQDSAGFQNNSNPNDPYAILGLRRGATLEEIKKAFREKMTMNHPDKLASLDPEIQKFATLRAATINDAYERLTAN